MVPEFTIFILHGETRRASLQQHLRHQDFSTQLTESNLCEGGWVFSLPGLLYMGLGPEGSGLNPSCARWVVVLMCDDWMRPHMSKSFINCNTNINCHCWITYKCNLGIFHVWELFIMHDHTMPLTGQPLALRKHLWVGPYPTHPKQPAQSRNRQSEKGPNLIAVCSGCNLQWEGREEKPPTFLFTHGSGHNIAIQIGQRDTIPKHLFG